MLITILLLKFIAGIIALKNNLKLIGYFLFSNLAIDIITQLLKEGTGIVFIISIFFYLSNAALLFLFSGFAAESKSIKQNAGLSLLCVFSLIGIHIHSISNEIIMNTIYAYYGSLAAIASISLVSSLMKKLSITTGIMMMFNFGCLMELFVVKMFGVANYWVINICNVLFYLTVIVVSLLLPKYKNLLSP